jgi:hypothetical protein
VVRVFLEEICHLESVLVLVERDSAVLLVADDGKITEVDHESKGIPSQNDLDLEAGEARGVALTQSERDTQSDNNLPWAAFEGSRLAQRAMVPRMIVSMSLVTILWTESFGGL